MKAAAVDYHRATSLDDAVQRLASAEDGKILAGGQSLVPLLNMRLARPALLVDINRLDELAHIRRENGHVEIGAMARHRAVETSELVRRDVALVAESLRHVGHVTIRNRGTIGGSLAHADPAAELPAVALALDAQLTVQGPAGTRHVDAADFFHGYLMSALEPEEILTGLRVPVLPEATGCAVAEMARRHGDFALVAVFVALTRAPDGTCERARIALAGAAPAPVRARAAEDLLVGTAVQADAVAAAAREIAAVTDPPDDIHAPAEYRRRLASVLGRRALAQAWERAR